jgi:RNA polymerase-interacting CarD/CdnL/TRCF family regulator
MFGKGDWIVHNHYGVGQVKGVDVKILGGIKKKYYKVITDNSIFWVPIDSIEVEHIRPVVSQTRAKKALSLVRRAPKDLDENHKTRVRQIMEIISDGAFQDKARLIRDLSARKLLKKRLNTKEQEVLDRAKKHFVREYAVATKTKPGEVLDILERALERSASKVHLEET